MSGKVSWLGGLAVLALVWRAIAQKKASPQPPQGQTFAGPVKEPNHIQPHWLRRNGEPIVMFVLSVTGFALGAFFTPQSDNEAPLPQVLRVEVTAAINAGHGWRYLKGLSWTESRDNAHQFKPPLAPQATRVEIMANYAKNLFDYDEMVFSHDTPISLKVDIPDGADVLTCQGGVDEYGKPYRFKWHKEDRQGERDSSDLSDETASPD
jgi:hypothetical protein